MQGDHSAGGSGQAGVRGAAKEGVPGNIPEPETSELLAEELAW